MSEHSRIPTGGAKFVLALISFVFPPLTVLILKDYNVVNWEFLASIILTILGHLPGALFSLWYLLYGFPEEVHLSEGRDGYIRLPDEESAHQAISSEAAPIAPAPAEGTSAPPTYAEIAAGHPEVSDSKGDHKVQH